MKADDGHYYFVKSPRYARTERSVVTERVVARIAGLVGAPVPPAVLLDLPDELVVAEGDLEHLGAGLCHASRSVDGVTDREGFSYYDEIENRDRFARLAVLYSWFGVQQDHQFFYSKRTPHLVWSFDHGHFLPGGPNWTVATLVASQPAAHDAQFAQCNLSDDEWRSATEKLLGVSDADIASTIASIPLGWVPDEDLRAFGDYLARRRDELLALVGLQKDAG